jgi:hypothetical protein
MFVQTGKTPTLEFMREIPDAPLSFHGFSNPQWRILDLIFNDIFDKYSFHKPNPSPSASSLMDDEYRVTSDELPLAKRTRHNQLSSRSLSMCPSSKFRYVSAALTSRQRLLPHSTPLPRHLQRIPEPRSKL